MIDHLFDQFIPLCRGGSGIRLYVVDTNNGLFMVDLEKNSKDLLVEKDSKETRFQCVHTSHKELFVFY